MMSAIYCKIKKQKKKTKTSNCAYEHIKIKENKEGVASLLALLVGGKCG